MKTTKFTGFLCFALAMFAMPAATQAAGQTNPANSSICEEAGLYDEGVTPGLQGLCVAMCEAQACVVEYNPRTEQLDFGPGCNPSSETLLANYNKLAGPSDPDMPCYYKEPECPCWTEKEISNIGGLYDRCVQIQADAYLEGSSTNPKKGGREIAYTMMGSLCIGSDVDFTQMRWEYVDPKDYSDCRQSVIDQCTVRGLLE